MILEARSILLKNGKNAILKTPCATDAAEMLRYIKTACGETDFLIRYPEEWQDITIEGEKQWVERLRASSTALSIACYIDGEIAGNCEINFNRAIKMAHRASVHIALIKKYWGLGIGSAMFAELIAAAKARPEIEILELEFIEGNDRARALYEKFGFEIVGERPNAFKLKDGRLLKEYFMQKDLRKK